MSPAAATTIEPLLHTACVRAGAAAALQVVLERLPLLAPVLPSALRDAVAREGAEATRRRLVQSIYRRHGLKPAGWEVEAILGVASAQTSLTPLATREGLALVIRGWLPAGFDRALLRWTPLAPLVTETVAAVAQTWAAGRYADSVCRVRRLGSDWLPAPLAEALRMAPSTLEAWSGEALALAMPPLRFVGAMRRQLAAFAGSASQAAVDRVRKSVASASAEKKTPRKRAAPAPGAKKNGPAQGRAVSKRRTSRTRQ